MNNNLNQIAIWVAKNCCYCQEKFTKVDYQIKNYRLFVYANEHAVGILVMVFHKQCWTKYNEGLKTAYQQITNDPIFKWV